LYALDAATGRPVETFGAGGQVDLRDDLGRDVSDLYVTARTPGIVFEDLLIQGTSLSEGPATAPGHLRAYDVRTGAIAWTFHTIPHPGEPGHETWPPDAWKRSGGANAWAGFSLDAARGLVFAPTGSAAFDFYGGDRHGANLYANSIVALDARTGRLVWHYQTVHHDLWDRDLPAPPNLVTAEIDGQRRDAVAQVTKSGFVFVLDRETGAPLFPVEERPVPASDLRGEAAWPTQPFPTAPPPFARQTLAEADLTDRTPEARAAVLDQFRRIRNDGPFTPPSEEGTLVFPGFDGGAEWGGAAFDPETGHLVVNSNEMPWILTMVDVAPTDGQTLKAAGRYVYTTQCAACHGADRAGQQDVPALTDLAARRSEAAVRQALAEGRGRMPSFGHLTDEQHAALLTYLLDRDDPPGAPAPEAVHPEAGALPYAHTGWHRWLDPDGYPAVRPPWGTLTSIDLGRGAIAWQVPLGAVPELTAQGLPPTGTENYGGPVVTAGGLIFIAATKDEKIRAFDKRTGRVLWEADLPAGGYATPAVYAVDGRQYVVVAAGGGKMGTPSGDAYVAFALP
ncbi:MAG: PQQ-binding-like beta-propeller repeat protein, partial [Rhodothermales bacterium]|nr:PQQ-binding-like beta-propeller repeat protein [Rhodothermales bacterium]